MAQNDNNNSGMNFLFWTPAAVGAGIGATRMVRDMQQANPRNWFTDPTSSGRAARDQVISARTVSTPAVPVDYMARIDNMALEGTWSRGLSTSWAKNAVAEASRASLLQGARMPIESIDALTRNILAPKGYSDFFDIARQRVSEAGDPRVFWETLGRYVPLEGVPFSGQSMPGVFLGNKTVNKMFSQAMQSGRTARWRYASRGANLDWWKSVAITEEEKARLGTFQERLGPTAKVTGIGRYPGDITMARMQVGLEGLPAKLNLTLPLHPSRYMEPNAEYVMNKIYSGVPSRGGEVMSWADYYVKQVNESLIPGIQEAIPEGMDKADIRRIIKQRTKEFESELGRYMMWTPSANHPGLNFINDLNAATIGAPELSEIAVRHTGDKPNIDREMGLLFDRPRPGEPGLGLFPGKSGGEILAGKMMGGVDPRAFWAHGEDFSFEYRPLQFLREFTPTKNALAAMAAHPAAYGFSREMPFLATQARKELIHGGLISPQLLVGYALSDTTAQKSLEKIGLSNEGLLVRQELMSMFETERITTMKLGLHESIGQGNKIADWLQRAAVGEVEPLRLQPGEQIGYEMKTGRPLRAATSENMIQELIGAQIGGKAEGQEAAQLLIRETHATDDLVKLFGPFKVSTRGRDAAYWSKVEKDIGLQMTKNLDAIGFADSLRKHRSNLKQQMESGMAMLAQKRLDRMDELIMQLEIAKGRGMTGAAERIGSRLDAYDRGMSKTAWTEMQDYLGMSAEQIKKKFPDELSLLKAGKSWGLDVRLFAGSMEEAAGILPPGMLEEARTIAGKQGLVHPSGLVVGAAFGSVGDYRHTMGGGILEGGIRGSIEPRGILAMMQHNWQAGESNAAHMLVAENLRLMSDYTPDINEAIKIGRSMLGEEIEGIDKLAAWGAENRAINLPMRKTGYMLDLGVPMGEFGGASSIYVPGEEAMHRFGQFRGEAGEILQTDLAKKYDQLARAANKVRALHNDSTAIESLDLASRELKKAVMGEASRSMYGRGGGSGVFGMLRGKRLGSRFLYASEIDEMVSKAEQGVVELSGLAGQQMYNELEKAAGGAEELQYIKAQRAAFLRGEAVPAWLARHPFIGPYSNQMTMARIAPGERSLKEAYVNLPARTMEQVEVLGDASKILGKQMMVNMSPAVGMALDFDADRAIIGLIGDKKTADAMTQALHGGNYMKDYKRFAAKVSVLNQLAKKQLGPAAATELSDLNQLVKGSTKLRIAAAKTAGISLSMSEAKLAMSYYKPESAPLFNMISEMMEQQIIGAKHMTAIGKQDIATKVSSYIDAIGSGNMAEQDFNALVGETEKMFGPQLKAGIDLQNAELGKFDVKVDARQLWGEAREALTQGREKGGIISRYRKWQRGVIPEGDLNVQEMINHLDAARVGKLSNLEMLAAGGTEKAVPGKMAQAVTGVIRGINTMKKELGSVAKTWYRPAFIGLAATAAAAMLLGGPKSQPLTSPPRPASGDKHGLVPAGNKLSVGMMRGITPLERDMRPESLPISRSVRGQPTAAGMPSPSTYMTNSPPLNYRVVARARSDDFSPTHQAVTSALNPIVGDANMQVNFRDNRAALTSQRINDMLQEA